jgi:hypothetical protein
MPLWLIALMAMERCQLAFVLHARGAVSKAEMLPCPAFYNSNLPMQLTSSLARLTTLYEARMNLVIACAEIFWL